MDQNEARKALEAMQGAKERLADVYKPFPAWRHGLVGLGCGVIVLQSAAPDEVRSWLSLISVLTVLWMVRNERETYGLSVRGIQRGGNLLFALGVSALFFGLIYLARSHGGQPFPSPVVQACALAAAALGVAASLLRRRLYRNGLARSERA